MSTPRPIVFEGIPLHCDRPEWAGLDGHNITNRRAAPDPPLDLARGVAPSQKETFAK